MCCNLRSKFFSGIMPWNRRQPCTSHFLVIGVKRFKIIYPHHLVTSLWHPEDLVRYSSMFYQWKSCVLQRGRFVLSLLSVRQFMYKYVFVYVKAASRHGYTPRGTILMHLLRHNLSTPVPWFPRGIVHPISRPVIAKQIIVEPLNSITDTEFSCTKFPHPTTAPPRATSYNIHEQSVLASNPWLGWALPSKRA